MKTDFPNSPLGDGGIEIRLWEYIDGHCAAEERSIIERLIAENALWREKYAELLAIHQSISATELEQPSLRFTKNVMEEIAKHHIAPATKKYINKKIIWGIAAFFITVITGIVIYSIAQINWSAGTNSENTIGNYFSQIDYSKLFNNTFINIFMMVNIVLGLMLLDRYLTGKKNKFIQET